MDPSIKALKRSGRIDLFKESFLHQKKKDYKEIINLRSSKFQKYCSKGVAFEIATPFFIGIIQLIIFHQIKFRLLKINLFLVLKEKLSLNLFLQTLP
jgi:hypothetical protein